MTETDIQSIIAKQRAFFAAGNTRKVSARKRALKSLYQAMSAMEKDLLGALKEDLGKSSTEGMMCETGLAQSEISWLYNHLNGLAREKRVPTPMAQYFSRSYQKPSPYGTALIMSPWNYPILLSIEPLADAIAAGNTVVLKPSAYAPASSAALKRLIEQVFPEDWVCVVTGGREENSVLLEQKWDTIFFTGSKSVGRLVLEKAAKNLTPVTLELGGKSPCVIDDTADIPLAARRIVWGKFLNCGQTCVAPDYILCDPKIRPELIRQLQKEIHVQFGPYPCENPNYGKIINEKHFNRLTRLIDSEKIVIGGRVDPEALKIEPTVLDNVTWDDPVMQEEIFGPVLPILTYDDFDSLPAYLREKPEPLALYIFSEDRQHIKKITDLCQFGGGCVNDCVIHLATSAMPFGGVGESGMGAYHGKKGFETFSHTKSIVNKRTWMDMPMRYQPYKPLYVKLIRFFLR